MDESKYNLASANYRAALHINNVPEIMLKYANACRLNKDYNEAVKYYKKVLDKGEPVEYKEAKFWLGITYKHLGLYQQAQRQFIEYYKAYREDYDYFIKRAKHEILSCEKALYMTFKPRNIEMESIGSGINTQYSEYMAINIKDSLLYYYAYQDKYKDTIFKSEIYKARKAYQKWTASRRLPGNVNCRECDVKGFTFTPDHKTMYLGVCKYNNNLQDCNLYVSHYSGGNWSKAKPLPNKINNSSTFDPAYAHTKNGDYLIFVSDRKKRNYGKYDIWYCPVDSAGEFGRVQNIGKTINSIEDEIAPFYDNEDGILYFSSRWHNNFGGFDIFMSEGDFVNRWRNPENPGTPVNSINDDIYYTISTINKKTRRAYLGSNRHKLKRPGEDDLCCFDLYTYTMPKVNMDSIRKERRMVRIKKEVELLVPITLYFHNDIPNPKSMDTTTEVNFEDVFKEYFAMIPEYKEVFSKGLRKNEQEEAKERIERFFVDEVEPGFDELVRFSVVLEELMLEGETVEIVLKGYASPLNTADYNANLSKRRIHSIMNFFREYKDGVLVPYIEGTTEKGRILFKQEAFGEHFADRKVSDDLKDLRNSVYSPDAARERKIRIIAVNLGGN